MLDQMLAVSRRRFVSPMALARVYSGLGDKEQVFAQLERGLAERDPLMTWLKVDPRLDLIRSDPRYRDLLARMKL